MIHNIKFRAFVYENESVDEISQSILNILPEAEIEAEEAEGMLEDKIIILSGTVSKKRYTKTFFNTLLHRWKSPQVPHTDRQVACHPVNNSRGKRS